MNHRDRLEKTIHHEDPGSVVADLNSTAVTGIAASAVVRLRQALQLPEKTVRVHEPYQLLGEVDDDLLEALGCDVRGVWGQTTMFGFRNDGWKPWTLPDGTPVQVGMGFTTSQDRDGNTYLHPNGDLQAPPAGILPPGGYYFDNVIRPAVYDEDHLDGRADFSEQYSVYSEDDLRFLENFARHLYENTDYGLVGHLAGSSLGDIGHIPGPNLAYPHGIRNPLDWYMAHKLYPQYIQDIFTYETEIAIKNAELYWQAVGSKVQVMVVSGTDFGTQRAELLSPELFRKLYKPFFKQINDWIHQHTTWKVFFHSCGSIVRLLDDLAECGVDILNPVQCSAAGMDPVMLKEQYGSRFTFWGGGVNTQHTLPFGTPEQVREEVLSRLRIFAPGGGYVFSAIHNIQATTPLENILAMFAALREYRQETSAALGPSSSQQDQI